MSTSPTDRPPPVHSPLHWRVLPCRKAQMSIEIMGLFTFLVMLLIAMIFVSYRDRSEITRYTEDIYARNVIDAVRMGVNTAAIEGDGFSGEFTVPPTLNGAQYNLTISGNNIYLTWSGSSHTGRVITRNITGTVSKGVNRISNVGGVIVFG